MGMITWTKPNGNKITTNDEEANVEYCEALGFKRVAEEVEKAPAKKPAKK